MPNIAIMLSSASAVKGQLYLSGTVCVDSGKDSEIIGWGTFIPWNTLPAEMNKAIVNAAMLEANAAGHVIGDLDNKMLFSSAGAVSL